MTAVLVLFTLVLIVALITVIYTMLDEDYFDRREPGSLTDQVLQPTLVLVEDVE